MKNPYTYNEIKGILKALGLKQSWIADKTYLTRQQVYNIGQYDEDSSMRKRYMLLCTYILDDYMKNELRWEPERIDNLLTAVRCMQEAVRCMQEAKLKVRKAL